MDSYMGGGPMISGEWINKQTGEHIFVKNAVQDGDNLVVVTNKGAISMQEFSAFYFQTDESYEEPVASSSAPPVQSMPAVQTADYSQYLTEEDKALLMGKPISQSNNLLDVSIQRQSTTQTTQNIKPSKSKNYDIIDKFFNKLENKPTINVSINWTDIPTTKLLTLIDYLDIPIDEISEYIFKEYANNDSIKEEISSMLNNMLDIER